MSQKELMVYLNGEFVPESEARVSVFDRCFLYGDGVFEGIAVWKGVPFKLDAHLKRMFKGLSYLRIENPLSPQEWKKAIMETIRLNDIEDGYLRPQVSRGEGLSSIKWQPHLLRKATPNFVIIPVKGFKDYYAKLFGERMKTGLTATVLSRPRIPSKSIPSGMKHCNYLNSVLGAIEVTASGANIGIATDNDGYVTEGIGYNVFIVKDGKLYTPPVTRDLLPGTTRAAIIEVARRDGYDVAEADFDVLALCSADEVFICSSMEFCGPVVEIDGRKIGDGKPGPITERTRELLVAELDREAKRFKQPV
jgi:branched-chain amino acid aminotransferase